MALPIELTLEDYWRIIKRRRLLAVFAFGATVFVTAVYSWFQEPVYSSFATLKIEPPAGSTGVAGSFANWDPYSGVNTEMRVMGSAASAEAALRKLGKISDSTAPQQEGALIADFMARTRVERVGDTTLVTARAEAPDPFAAAAMAQALSDAYMQLDVESRTRQNQQALENISKRKEQIESVLHDLEEEKRRLLEASPTGSMKAMDLANRLFDLEAKKKSLLGRYTENHPEVQQLNAQILLIQKHLKILPREVLEIARVERDARVNEELYLSLAKQYEEQRVAAASTVSLAHLVAKAIPNPIPIRPNRRANMTFGAVLGVVLGLILVFVAENLDTSLSTVEEVEKTLGLPVLGLIPHIDLPGQRDGPNWKAWLPIMVKHEPMVDLRKRTIIYQPSHSPVVEAYHSLRASLESVLPKQSGHAVVFASSGIAEGKTLSSMNFALAAVQAGVRVVLVEADLRRPSLHRMLGVSNDVGLTNVLIEGAPLERVLKGSADFMIGTTKVELLLQMQGIENLNLLPAGSIKANPTDLLKREAFSVLIEKLKKSYDWVILDCPPLLLFADGLIVSPQADGVVIFYQVGRMSRSAVKRAKEELLTVKAKPLGLVLNDVRPTELEPRYGYYKSHEYYHHYTEDGEEKKA